MMTDKPVSEMSADELWSAVTGTGTHTHSVKRAHCIAHGAVQDAYAYQHVSCPANLCPYCATPVTNAQINDGDAFPIDERGADDGKYAHRACVQGARYEP